MKLDFLKNAQGVSQSEADKINAIFGRMFNQNIEKRGVDVNKLHEAADSEVAYKGDEALPEALVNSGEIISTGTSGYGAELIPTNVLLDSIVEYSLEYGKLMPYLTSYHGSGMPQSAKVSVMGEDPLFLNGPSELTDANSGYTPWITSVKQFSTDSVTITQAQFYSFVTISDPELKFSIVDLERKVREKLVRGATRTMEAVIINGDAETGSTGNVNLDDAAPGGTEYYLAIDHGIRELAINNTLYADIGAFDITDFTTISKGLGELASNPEECVWITNRKSYNKMLTLQAFYDASQRGEASTIKGNAITSVLGSDMILCRDFPMTEADAKVSTTAGNNTKGGLGYLYAPAVQWGLGSGLEIEAVRLPARGIQIVASFYMGFVIVNQDAGFADPSVYLGYNMTV